METSGAVEMEPLKVVEVEVGHLYRDTVRAVPMRRATLLGLAEEVIAENGLEAIRDLVLASARTISHYPVGEWVNARGCGCIVGEMMCAGVLHDPAVNDREMLADSGSITEELVQRDPVHGRALETFGMEIDQALHDHFRDSGLGGYEVILFTDVVEGEAS